MTRNRVLGLGAAAVAAMVIAAILIVQSQAPLPRYGEVESTGESSAPNHLRVHRLGEVVTLKTYLTTIQVRPLDSVDLPPSPDARNGVGVQLVVRNIGQTPYTDQPGQAASLMLRGGGEAERLYATVGGCGGAAVDTVTIPPGQARRFCLPFGPVKRSDVDLFVYAPESGIPTNRGAPDVAAWSF